MKNVLSNQLKNYQNFTNQIRNSFSIYFKKNN